MKYLKDSGYFFVMLNFDELKEWYGERDISLMT